MRKYFAVALLGIAIACATAIGTSRVIIAQTLPYTLTVTWNAATDAASYNCYLDNVKMTNVTTTTCSFPVATLGAHVVGVTSFNDTFVPNESTPATLNFTLKQPSPPAGVKVK